MAAVLAVALLAVVGVIVYRDLWSDRSDGPTEVVTGVIGSEKLPFFSDQRVRDIFAHNGIELRVDPAGSRRIAETVPLDQYDFAFPSSHPAADRILRDRPAARTYAPFSSPMAIATYAPIVDLLTAEGMVEPGGTFFDMRRYLDVAQTGARWDQLPGNTAFPARRNILLSTTALCDSNSASMYLAIASYVANGDHVVSDPAGVDRVAPLVGPLFVDQGYQPATTEVLFEDYLSSGMGRVPMALVYEAQFVGQQVAEKSVLPTDARLLYPRPTVYSRHVLVPLTSAGDRVGQLLEEDPELARLAAEHGFRPTQPGPFAQALQDASVAAPPELIDVVEPPTFETSERFLGALGCAA
ncbi:hypothetical protein [Millisia brevis]|uniref:hypothetical protein n=1 Tax=Millisia brevis TaxID=264148 RepID=UPI001C3F3951|nr:hypothetical protein [Millisia brevis]